MAEPTCPNCGMSRNQWQEPGGYTIEGRAYCCRGCAEGTGCTCRMAPGGRPMTDEEIRRDKASGDFVQSLQKERKTVSEEDYGTEAITKSGGSDYSHD